MPLTSCSFHAHSSVSVARNALRIGWHLHRKKTLEALTVMFFAACVAPLPGSSQEVVFKAPVDHASGGYAASSVAVADVNGDGKPDIVVANQCASSSNCANENGTVGVLLGNGDGTFQPVVTYASGGHDPTSVAVADVNGDGKPDLVVASTNSSNGGGVVGVLLGNGDGTFQAAVTYASGGYSPSSVAVADVNGDGKPDLVVANESGSVGVLLGNGDGTFQSAVSYSSGAQEPLSVAVADVNGDGKPDLVVANSCVSGGCNDSGRLGGVVGVLLGNGDGTFQTAATYGSGGYYAYSVAVADVNGDGKPDLVVANQCVPAKGCAIGSVGVLLGNGDGTFQAAVTYGSGGNSALSVAVADVNGDGKPDLVVQNLACQLATTSNCPNTMGVVGVLLGNSDGTFQTAATYGSGGEHGVAAVADVAVADVNGDGKPDLLVANYCASSSNCVNGVVGVLINMGLVPSMTVSSSVNPSVVDQPITITATVTSSYGSPTGSVTFSDGSTVLGTSGLGPSGISALNTALSTAGKRTITADYNGDAKFGPYSSSLAQQVNKAATKTLLSSSLNPSLIGQSVTFTATVTFLYAAPTGTVEFKSQPGAVLLATETLTGNTASFTTEFSTAKSYSIYAVYSGDANFLSSTSASVAQKVNEFPTSTAVTSNLNPSNYSESVTFNATISSSYGPPTGTVTFRRGTTALGTVALSGNTASFSTSALNAGTNSINAVYSGDASFATSTSPNLSQKVNKIASTTALASSVNPSTPGQSVTFTATVTAASGTPTGMVTFKNGSTTLGTATLTGATATFATSTLPSGSNSIKASYGGSTNYQTSSSAALTQLVQ